MHKIAVIIATHNNPVLLRHALDNYKRYDPGADCDYYLVDSGDNADGSPINATRIIAENDRVEALFDKCANALHKEKRYTHYFFAHDDCAPHKAGWLYAFLQRLESNYAEPETPEIYKHLPIGRVGAMHHYWRDYSSVKGWPVQARFLRCAWEVLEPEIPAPCMFKYADVDRILMTRECYETSGIVTTQKLAANHALESVLHQTLPYYDEGTYPLDRYPPGNCWNRLTLLAEFLNSLQPLARGFRTVGLHGDGYLEQMHGADVPHCHDHIAHYGAPNALSALAKVFHCKSQDVKRKFSEPAFLIKTHRYFKDYYK